MLSCVPYAVLKLAAATCLVDVQGALPWPASADRRAQQPPELVVEHSALEVLVLKLRWDGGPGFRLRHGHHARSSQLCGRVRDDRAG